MDTDRKLPEGVADITESDCALKNKIEASIARALDSFGYNEIQTPTFEYLSVFSDDMAAEREDIIKFIDTSGRIMALRPDYTPSISRFTALHKSEADLPLRLRYRGSIFRGGESFGARQKEFTQAGAELIGDPSPEADAEVICATIEALLQAGLSEFQLELGHPGFLKGLIAGKLSEADFAALVGLLDKKAVPEIEDFCAEAGVDKELSALLCRIPLLYGNAEIAEDMLGRGLGDECEAALRNLLEVCYAIEDCGYGRFISVDLGLVRSFDYYTGVMFKGLTHNMAFPICGGGRYDGLSGRFGGSFPSTGTAIWPDRVMAAISRGSGRVEYPETDVLVWYNNNEERAAAHALALRERQKGKRVICEKHDFRSDDEVCRYLSAHHILSASKAEKGGRQ
ncbi:MAG: ATP phosphoribosyltransferase regulatory subunit [Oscillospiraceae bacterium]|nr:ATP phosphoribosyltransferase regulatory subunit [Oscillospiraceae bacterium]